VVILVQIYCFLPRTLFCFICPQRPASWVGSRAGSPFSQYASLVPYLRQVGRKEVDMNDVRMASGEYAGRQHNMFPEKYSS
jgi:hypothetical protein